MSVSSGWGKWASPWPVTSPKPVIKFAPGTAHPVDAPGLTLVKTAREAFQADVVFTMLSDDAALRAVVLDGGLLKDARKGLVHVGLLHHLDRLCRGVDGAARRGRHRVMSPRRVFGRPDVAEAAQLNVVVAGAESAIDKVAVLLSTVGRKTWPMGERPAQANAAKIAGNMMIGMAIGAMSEATLLSEGNGVAPKAFFELILESLFGCRVYQSYSAKIVAEEYSPGFKMSLGLKDLRLAAKRRSAPASAFRSSTRCATR